MDGDSRSGSDSAAPTTSPARVCAAGAPQKADPYGAARLRQPWAITRPPRCNKRGYGAIAYLQQVTSRYSFSNARPQIHSRGHRRLGENIMRSICLPAMARSIRLSRRDIFGDDSIDRPQQPAGSVADKDSDTPQIGYIGPRYQAGGVVAVGDNPGDGRSASRNPGDQMLMPALECFRERCDETTYLRQIEVAQVVSQGWSIW